MSDFNEQINTLYRKESSRLMAILTRIFGSHNFAMVEDVIQDAFSRASIYWEENSSLLIIDALSVEVSPTELTDYPFSVFYFFNGITCQLDSFVNIQILELILIKL
mgnify:CR=1 FL=1